MPEFTDKQKMDAVAGQLRIFSKYLARLGREKRLTPEQDKTGVEVCLILEAVIEDYKAKIEAGSAHVA